MILFIVSGVLFILLLANHAEEQERQAWQEQRKADRRRNARFAEEFKREVESTAYIHK